MTNTWWSCYTCGHELYDSQSVLHHREDTGHIGAGLCTDKVPTTGPGSSDEAREAALKAAADAIRDAKVRGGRL